MRSADSLFKVDLSRRTLRMTSMRRMTERDPWKGLQRRMGRKKMLTERKKTKNRSTSQVPFILGKKDQGAMSSFY